MSLSDFSDSLFVGSLLIQIPATQDTVQVEKDFGFGTKPVGAVIILSDCKYGDTGKLEIIHPTSGVVGSLGEADLPEGQREISISVEDGNTEVPVGLKYRFTLDAVDTDGRNVIVWLLVKR